MDKREQELIAAVAKAESKWFEAAHKRREADRKRTETHCQWAEAYNALKAYRAANRGELA